MEWVRSEEWVVLCAVHVSILFLQNMQVKDLVPEPGCTYYEQFVIDRNRFRIGKLSLVPFSPCVRVLLSLCEGSSLLA